MAASAKTLLLGAAGLAVAGVVLYLVAFADSEKKTEPRVSAPVDAPKTPVPEGLAAPVIADAPKVPDRTEVGAVSAAATGGVEGVITDDAGKPVAGALVALRKPPPVVRAPGRLPDPLETTGYSARSNADGSYRVAAPPGDEWRLSATHPSYAKSEHSGLSTTADVFITFPLSMRAGVRVSGRVLDDATGKPISGAQIGVDTTPAQQTYPPPLEDRREATTTASGEFAFENVREGRHSLTVRAQGYASKLNGSFNVSGGAERAQKEEVRLAVGKSITGKVVDTNGGPVPGARVVSNVSGTTAASAEAKTNDRGEFTLADLESGAHYLSANADGFGDGKPEPAAVQAGTANVVITLAPRGIVSGVVRDRTSGAPLASFLVEARLFKPNSPFVPRSAGPMNVSSKDGTFQLGGLDPKEQHVIVVSSETHAPGWSEAVSVQPGQVTQGVEILVAAGGTVFGRVVDSRNGKPVAGAAVRTRDNMWNDLSGLPIFNEALAALPSRSADRRTSTDQDGKFEIPHIDAGTIQLEVSHPAFIVTRMKDVQVTEGGRTDAGAISILSGGTVKGVVYGADGKPAPNAEVRLRSIGFGPGRAMLNRQARADQAGRFWLRGIPAGEYNLTVGASGSGERIDIFPQIGRGPTQISVTEGAQIEQSLFLPKP